MTKQKRKNDHPRRRLLVWRILPTVITTGLLIASGTMAYFIEIIVALVTGNFDTAIALSFGLIGVMIGFVVWSLFFFASISPILLIGGAAYLFMNSGRTNSDESALDSGIVRRLADDQTNADSFEDTRSDYQIAVK